MKSAVIYARVSSDRQKEEHTVASQTEALRAFALREGFSVPVEWVIEDEGYSGATLLRPGLEKVRDLAAEGQIDAVLVYSPDRLSRKYAYQVLLIEEFARSCVSWQAAQVKPANSPVSSPGHCGVEITVLLIPIGKPSGLYGEPAGWVISP
jgi:site-specific DNA recombinase